MNAREQLINIKWPPCLYTEAGELVPLGYPGSVVDRQIKFIRFHTASLTGYKPTIGVLLDIPIRWLKCPVTQCFSDDFVLDDQGFLFDQAVSGQVQRIQDSHNDPLRSAINRTIKKNSDERPIIENARSGIKIDFVTDEKSISVTIDIVCWLLVPFFSTVSQRQTTWLDTFRQAIHYSILSEFLKGDDNSLYRYLDEKDDRTCIERLKKILISTVESEFQNSLEYSVVTGDDVLHERLLSLANDCVSLRENVRSLLWSVQQDAIQKNDGPLLTKLCSIANIHSMSYVVYANNVIIRSSLETGRGSVFLSALSQKARVFKKVSDDKIFSDFVLQLIDWMIDTDNFDWMLRILRIFKVFSHNWIKDIVAPKNVQMAYDLYSLLEDKGQPQEHKKAGVLLKSCANDDLITMKHALRLNAELSTLLCQDAIGKTPLLWALDWNNDKMVRYLFQAGADVNTLRIPGDSASAIVFQVIRQKQLAILPVLVSNKGFDWCSTCSGQTLFHYVCSVEDSQASHEMLTILLYYFPVEQHSKFLDFKDTSGSTALSLSLLQNNDDNAVSLIKAGAGIHSYDVILHSQRCLACLRAKPKIDSFLKNRIYLFLKNRTEHKAIKETELADIKEQLVNTDSSLCRFFDIGYGVWHWPWASPWLVKFAELAEVIEQKLAVIRKLTS